MTDTPKPYEPMVGDVIELRATISNVDRDSVTVEFGNGASVMRDGITHIDTEYRGYTFDFLSRNATLVSRPEKPLAVGDRVRLQGGDTGKLVGLYGDAAWVLFPGSSGIRPSTVPLRLLRRAPEDGR